MYGKKLNLIFAAVFLAFANFASAQITTAGDYFRSVSEYYGTIRDYEADMDITMSGRTSYAHASFKRPNLLRLDFSNPADQVILFNGDTLTVYLPPPTSAVLQQSAKSGESSGVALATPQGLSLMSRYYSVAYETGQAAVPLDENSDEQVIKLVLERRNTSEAFRTIRLAVNADTNLIRRIDATTPRGERYVFDFSNYRINQDIPDMRFVYDPPSSANIYNDFLLSE